MVLVGGVAALSWEVVWQLQATLAFGVSAAGTALTLAASMGGMTIGALAMGARLRDRSVARPLRLYGLLELLIGVSGLFMLPGFRILEVIDTGVYAAAPALAPFIHAVGMALLLGPATLAMGATVPVFQLVARRHHTSVAALYGMNTAGAAFGVLLLSFWLLPTYGVRQSCALIASLNGAVFVLTALLERRGGAADEAVEAAWALPPAQKTLRFAPQLIVLCTGFATFGLEVAWFRALRSAFWSTSSTFAILLAAVLLPLAIGARVVPFLRRRGITPAPMLLAAGAAILVGAPLVERMDLLPIESMSPLQVLGFWMLATLGAIGPAILFLATALPWFLETHPNPAATGRLYGLNTLGSVAGSLITAWGLLPWIGAARSTWVLGLLVLGAAALLYKPRARIGVAVVGAATLAVAIAFSSSAGRDRMHGRPNYEGYRLLAHDEGPDFTSSVIEWFNGDRFLFIDGFTATSDHPVGGHYMYWMGALPARLQPAPERGLVICFGTGQTANGLRHHVSGNVDVVEVSHAVLALSSYFDVNEAVLDDSRVVPIIMDGRAWLRRTEQRYDVITLEPMPPNFSGVNSLYSKEFYEIAARRLTPGGVVTQWVPFHLLDAWDAASITATFLAVFPDTLLWFDPVSGTGILAGRLGGGAEPIGEIHPSTAPVPANQILTDDQIRRSIILDQAPLRDYASRGTIITDDNQYLQFSQFRGRLTHDDTRIFQSLNQTILTRIAGRAPYRTSR
jgi:spermidine synthase